MAKITIDGVEYDTDAMTDDAKAQLTSIQFCENELRRLQAEASSLQTARNAYAIALKAELAKGSSSKAREPETVATPPNETSIRLRRKVFSAGSLVRNNAPLPKMSFLDDRTIFVPDYWPLFQTAERRIFYYTCPDGTEISFRSVFSYDSMTKSMRYENYDDSSRWLNTWFYHYRPGFGIAEWRDDHPLNGWRRKLFGQQDKHVFIRPIGWGENVTIGGVYQNRPVKNTLYCWPPMFSVSHQHVHFEDMLSSFSTYHGIKYKDVLVFRYKQRFGKRSGGARYYNACGIGPVAIEWIHYKDDGSESVKTRVDATVEFSSRGLGTPAG